jgi:hypothetical protein
MKTVHSSELSVNLYKFTQHHIAEGSVLNGLEVLTAVVMKNSVFWDVTWICSLPFSRRFFAWLIL